MRGDRGAGRRQQNARSANAFICRPCPTLALRSLSFSTNRSPTPPTQSRACAATGAGERRWARQRRRRRAQARAERRLSGSTAQRAQRALYPHDRRDVPDYALRVGGLHLVPLEGAVDAASIPVRLVVALAAVPVAQHPHPGHAAACRAGQWRGSERGRGGRGRRCERRCERRRHSAACPRCRTVVHAADIVRHGAGDVLWQSGHSRGHCGRQRSNEPSSSPRMHPEVLRGPFTPFISPACFCSSSPQTRPAAPQCPL